MIVVFTHDIWLSLHFIRLSGTEETVLVLNVIQIKGFIFVFGILTIFPILVFLNYIPFES